MIGRTLAHYRVLDKIGVGGMGAVYRAEDTRLGREVALKVLPEGLAADPARLDRFRREARALAAIDHPNIVTVYSVEEDDGTHFLTMALVAGDNLERKLFAGAMELHDLLDVGMQLADALATAHDRGVVHRDLKPANVMVGPDGHVTVLDFGLAKIAAEDPAESATMMQTQDGVVLGTVPYMSPEQLKGAALDHRSDVFSLGVLLYEMATGKRPFAGDNTATLTSAILRDVPPPVTDVDAALPPALAQLILRCLEKDPDDRFGGAAEVRGALGAVKGAISTPTPVAAVPPPAPAPGASPASAPAAGASPGHRAAAGGDTDAGKTVVVLPFANRSPDPDNEYFADGLTEEIISDLAGIGALRVISRNSAMTLKGTTKDTATLARELHVTHLVTGSVRRAGDALRVTAELVDVATDAPLWADKFSGTVEDVFGVQEEISRKIVAALEVRLTPSEERQVSERPIDDPIAYDAYLRARREMYGWTAESSERALRLVDDALAIAGENPLLLASKGQIYWSAANTYLAPYDESLDRALGLARRALAIDPELPLGIFVRGLVAGLRGDVESALEDTHRAHRRAPGDANVLTELCRFANAAGLSIQKRWVDESVRIDPLTPITHLVVSTYNSVTGNYRASAEAARRAVAMTPGASLLHVYAAWQIAESGALQEAVAILAPVARELAGSTGGAFAAFMKASFEHEDAGLDAPAAVLEPLIRNDHLCHAIAAGYAHAGRTADSLRWVRKSIDSGFINYPCLAEYDPFLGAVRDEPEFQRMMEELQPRWQGVLAWEAGLS